jgi:hypothetical protein
VAKYKEDFLPVTVQQQEENLKKNTLLKSKTGFLGNIDKIWLEINASA